MQIDPIKGMWIVLVPGGRKPWPARHSIARTRSESIQLYMQNWARSWVYLKRKYGVRCIKVDISFTTTDK